MHVRLSKGFVLVWYLFYRVREDMVFPHPGSGKKVSFSTQEVRESQGITFLDTCMNPTQYCIPHKSLERSEVN